ncbi:right-handed parallel beta-helix repeat-containing protein [Gordonia alkanivorans]|uniref:right-handed parallel beta-helix repeat-containing protein n=1 Tax=Gordonia alkanivorans TaxID=84096 RepID=UPI0012F4C5E2|nr:right-handed parallel beta-helix repeat-containing protein [Gordonia alkanivorans]
MTISSCLGDFMGLFMNCENVVLERLNWFSGTDVGEDGLHLYGGKNYLVRNCHISSGDDALSLTVESPENEPLEKVVVENCTLSSRMASGVKLHVKSAASQAFIEDVSFNDVTISLPKLRSGHDAVRILDERHGDSGIRRIRLNSVLADMGGGPGTGMRVHGGSDILVRGCNFVNGRGVQFWATASNGRSVRGLDIRDTIFAGSESSNREGIVLSRCEKFSLVRLTVQNFGSAGIQLTDCRYGDLSDSTVINSGGPGILLSNVGHASVIGNALIGTGRPVVENGESDGNTLDRNIVSSF